MIFDHKITPSIKKRLTAGNEILEEYIERLREISSKGGYLNVESSINLSCDDSIFEEVQLMKKKKEDPRLKYIIVIGIGGSNLGAKAVYDALRGGFDPSIEQIYPKIIFVDTVSPVFLYRLIEFLKRSVSHKNEVLINIISKSGETMETVLNAELIIGSLRSIYSDIEKRVIVTTDEGSKLWRFAFDKSMDVLSIPQKVGGRFSVLSAVGLFPLAMCGIDIVALRKGASDMKKSCLERSFGDNSAWISASIIKSSLDEGLNINDNFFFCPELESLGKWYRQLLAESIGKENNMKGEQVNCGITPTVSIGSTDLHSMGQLYLAGPKDKLTTFVYLKENQKERETLKAQGFLKDVLDIKGISPPELMRAIYEGTKLSYEERGLPFMEILFERLDERSIGEYLQFKMFEIMFLAKLLNIDAFNQLAVEIYKKKTRNILYN